MISETKLSYNQIYSNCLETISQYAENKKLPSALKEITKVFLANSPFQETYTLYLEGDRFSLRANGSFNSEALNQAHQLIEFVSPFAKKCGFIDINYAPLYLDNKTSLGETNENSRKKRKLTEEFADSTPSSQFVFDTKKAKDLLNSEKEKIGRQKNLTKAFKEHGKLYTIEHLFQSSFHPLTFKISMAQHQGSRDYMEDARFSQETETGFLAGVFDGHCDAGQTANYASKYFQDYFFLKLDQNPTHLSSLFVTMMDTIHKEMTHLTGGTTAVVCYIDKSTNFLYTATLSDSEAFVFRKKGDKISWFPVSCVRDWSCEKDAKRAVKGLKLYTSAYDRSNLINYPLYLDSRKWTEEKKPKTLRFPPHKFGINVSRTMGDYNNIKKWPAIDILSHKPKVTEFLLNSDDTVEECIVLGSDGIWDYIDIDQMIKNVLSPHWGEQKMAQMLVDYAIGLPEKEKIRDNATAICIYTQTLKAV